VLRLALIAIASLAAIGSSRASDLPGYPPSSLGGCAAQRFGGWYAGITGGGVNYTANRTDQDGVIGAPATYVQKDWGIIGGAHAGYTFARCYTVFGGELDGNWSNAKAHTLLLPNVAGAASITSRFDGVATARTRVGVAFDHLLLYLTGGIAFARTHTTWNANFGAPFNGEAAINQWRWGWVAGFGTEWAWTERILIRSEVLYIDLLDNGTQVLFYPAVPQSASFTHSDSIWISRFGITFRLGP
jgi:opacity protein-like surface antigen